MNVFLISFCVNAQQSTLDKMEDQLMDLIKKHQTEKYNWEIELIRLYKMDSKIDPKKQTSWDVNLALQKKNMDDAYASRFKETSNTKDDPRKNFLFIYYVISSDRINFRVDNIHAPSEGFRYNKNWYYNPVHRNNVHKSTLKKDWAKFKLHIIYSDCNPCNFRRGVILARSIKPLKK